MTGDKKMEFYRDEMIRDLRESDCNVIFTKVNGEERDMICTLNPDKINYELKGKETQPNAVSYTHLTLPTTPYV